MSWNCVELFQGNSYSKSYVVDDVNAKPRFQPGTQILGQAIAEKGMFYDVTRTKKIKMFLHVVKNV